MSNFVHLHNHSDFSLQDGAQSVEMLCNRIDDLGMDTIALTEHGNLFSMIPFYKEAIKKGIKPIIGCEIYVSVGSHTEKKQILTEHGKKWGYYHLVLLAKNNDGYKNLMKLVSIGYLNGFYYRPRVDKDLLRKYSSGIIATSACLAGEVTQFAAAGNYEGAKKAALEYNEIFNNNFYIELQNHNIPAEQKAHKILIKLSKELDIPLVATNDCHYAEKDHWEPHDVLFCLGTGKDRSDTNRIRYEPEQFYIKSADEMYNIFKDTPQALENTIKIAEQCDVNIPMGNYHLPNFPLPNNINSSEKYLEQISYEGAKNKFGTISQEIKNRLDYELKIINKMGFAGYFLITQDFVKHAKNNNIRVGPGRGSAAGSLIAYTLDITTVNPLKYNLLFERFLNPERITMPDIDIDFCMEKRENVIQYIKEKYGNDSVAQIITFGTMGAKSVIRDVGRVLGMSYNEVDQIAKMIPNELKMTLQKAEKMNQDFKKISTKDKNHEDLIKFSKVLEGLNRHASTHAAGIVIAPTELTNYVPLYKNPSTGDICTQVDMNSLEDIGLLKLDFLGLRNLTVIDKTLKFIKENYNEIIDINEIDLTDKKVFDLFSSAKTTGVFQFESIGVKEYLKQLAPTNIEDLIALTALYRPGPMANIPDFIARKKGNISIKYIHQSLETILKDTYGIIVYQEQVMQITSIIAGFTLVEADNMRRAMGKKKKNLMATFKHDFVEGAQKNNIDTKLAIQIFELLEKFADYGFNKSHATAYALLAYQTAWLKAHYPAEFLSANLNTEYNDTDRVAKLIDEGRKMKIDILHPDINTSYDNFFPIKRNQIAYGLCAIKNVGIKVANIIFNQRQSKGKYNNLLDLCRYNPKSINKKVLESLIKSGACDSLNGHRNQLFQSVEPILTLAQKLNKNEESNQNSLFSNSATEELIEIPKLIEVEKWPEEECLANEKELLGYYFSGHPLNKFIDDIKDLSNVTFTNNKKIPKNLRIGGILQDIKVRYDKKNRPWCIATLESIKDKGDIFIFNEVYEKNKDLIKEGSIVFLKGSISKMNENQDNLKIVVQKITEIKKARKTFIQQINLLIDENQKNKSAIDSVYNITKEFKGNYPLYFYLRHNGSIQIVKSQNCLVDGSHELFNAIKAVLGKNNIWIS